MNSAGWLTCLTMLVWVVLLGGCNSSGGGSGGNQQPPPGNSAPTANDASITVTAGGGASGTLSATDVDNDAITFRIAGNPANGTVTLIDPATGEYLYTDGGAAGSDSFTFIASDGRADSNPATVSVTIQAAPNGVPVAHDLGLDAVAGVMAGGTLSAGDPDGDSLTFSIIDNPGQGRVSIPDPRSPAFTYIAYLDASGTDSFTYAVNDGENDSNIATVTVAIKPRYRLTVIKAAGGNGLIYQSQPADGDVLSCDTDCTAVQQDYAEGTTVVLSVSLSPGTSGVSWEDCNVVNGNQCTIVMDTNKIIDVEFDPDTEITALPQTDFDGTFLLRWECHAPACSGGQYVIQQDSNVNFFNPTEFNHISNPGAPELGTRFFQDLADGWYFYRVRPSTGPSWSKPLRIIVDRLERDSVAADGRTQGNGDSLSPAISAYGEYVAFQSDADNLVNNDNNNLSDIFLRNTRTGEISLVSIRLSKSWANGRSMSPVITPDGRFIAFNSWASNLLATADNNNAPDYFVWDRLTGQIERVSITSDEQERSGGSNVAQHDISADGRFVVFMTDQDLAGEGDGPVDDVYLRDRQTGVTTLVSAGQSGGLSLPRKNPKITPNGRYVVYETQTHLMTPRNTRKWDIVRWDRLTGSTITVSNNAIGQATNEDSYAPDISADGRRVVFESFASNLITGDSNGVRDIFVKDLQTGEVKRLSQRRGLNNNIIEANDESVGPVVSQDGNLVAFTSYATNLRNNDNNGQPDVFLLRVDSSSMSLLTTWNANAHSSGAAISPEGLIAGFASAAAEIVRDDTNDAFDTFTWSGRGTINDPGPPDGDLDKDGLDNLTELTQTFTLHFVADSDNDGVNDGQEASAGTDPWNASSK